MYDSIVPRPLSTMCSLSYVYVSCVQCVCVSCIHLNVPCETGNRLPLVTAAGSGYGLFPSPRKAWPAKSTNPLPGWALHRRFSRARFAPHQNNPRPIRPGTALPNKPRGDGGKARATILFMRLHRSEQIPPRRNKNSN